MTTSPRFLILLSFAFICGTVQPAPSSKYIGSCDSVSAAPAIFSQSEGSRLPDLSRVLLTSASEASIRDTSCSLPISRENITTSRFVALQVFTAILSANADFPIAGRAAIMIRSVLLRPVVIASSWPKPVFAPRCSPASGPDISCKCSNVSTITSLIRVRP